MRSTVLDYNSEREVSIMREVDYYIDSIVNMLRKTNIQTVKAVWEYAK